VIGRAGYPRPGAAIGPRHELKAVLMPRIEARQGACAIRESGSNSRTLGSPTITPGQINDLDAD
jgi:hypothetical protein